MVHLTMKTEDGQELAHHKRKRGQKISTSSSFSNREKQYKELCGYLETVKSYFENAQSTELAEEILVRVKKIKDACSESR